MRFVLGLVLAGCVGPKPQATLPAADFAQPCWVAVRQALADCARQLNVSGDLRTHVEIDDDGGLGLLSVDGDDYALGRCAGAELSAQRFPGNVRGRRVELVVRTP